LGRDEQEAFLTYREPFISRFNVPLQVQVYQADDNTAPARTSCSEARSSS
jgi:hypothetical protein